MAKTVKGIVTAKYEKSGKTKKGGFYKNVRLEIDGEKTYGGFVDKGNKKVLSDIAEGDKVQLRVEQDGDFWNYSKVKLITKNADPGAAKAAKSKGGSVANGGVREFAASVGKGTGIVQALIGAKALKTEEEILEAIAFYSIAIHDLVTAYDPDESDDEEESEDESEEEEEEEDEDDDEDEDWDED